MDILHYIFNRYLALKKLYNHTQKKNNYIIGGQCFGSGSALIWLSRIWIRIGKYGSESCSHEIGKNDHFFILIQIPNC
jgi:hypothetical protein